MEMDVNWLSDKIKLLRDGEEVNEKVINNKMNMSKEYLSKNELKNYLGFSIGKINNMMKSNEIRYSKIGKRVLFEKDDVNELIKKNKVV